MVRGQWGKLPGSLACTHFSVAALGPAISLADLFSAVRTAWPATRSAHSFLEFRAYPLYVLSSGLRFLDGDNPADPLISLRASGVMSSHFARATGSEMRTFRKSGGTLCTAPGEIAFLFMNFILLRYAVGLGVLGCSVMR